MQPIVQSEYLRIYLDTNNDMLPGVPQQLGYYFRAKD